MKKVILSIILMSLNVFSLCPSLVDNNQYYIFLEEIESYLGDLSKNIRSKNVIMKCVDSRSNGESFKNLGRIKSLKFDVTVLKSSIRPRDPREGIKVKLKPRFKKVIELNACVIEIPSKEQSINNTVISFTSGGIDCYLEEK